MASQRVVRQPLRTRDMPRRTFEQRVGVRLPALWAVGLRVFSRLPPGSRVRRAILGRAIEHTLAAFNRRDLDVVVLAIHPDLEHYPYRQFVEAGLTEPCYHGPAGYREYIAATADVWGEEVRLDLKELVDLGDRMVVLADMPMRAQASGVALSETYGSVWTVKDGLVVRMDDFLDHGEALRAAGVD